MRLRPHRRNLVVWSPSAVPGGKTGILRGPRPARATRIRWWLRTGALLMFLGVLRFARASRARWEPVFLLGGTLLTLAGVMLPATGAFFLGLLALIVTLIKGIGQQQRDAARPTPAAGQPHRLAAGRRGDTGQVRA